MKKRKDMIPQLTTAILFVGLTSSAASANELCMTLDGFDAYESYGVAINSNMDWFNNDTVTFTSPIKAGERVWTTEYGTQVVTYCAQIWESASAGDDICFQVVEDLTQFPEYPPYPGPMNTTQVGLVEDLYARYIDIETGYLRAGTALTDDYDYDTAASAFQLVVWEITHENIAENTLATGKSELSLGLGAFRANTADNVIGGQAADLIMASLGSNGWLSMGDNLRGLTSETMQDQFMVVPLPMPAVLAGIGLIGATVLRRRIG